MSTVVGPMPCRSCSSHVWVVRRTVEVPCDDGCEGNPFFHDDEHPHSSHTHAIPDVAWTVVDAEGERHLCDTKEAA